MKVLQVTATIMMILFFGPGAEAATLEVTDLVIESPYEDNVGYEIDGHEVLIEMTVQYDPAAEPIFKRFTTNGNSGIIHLTEIIHVEGDIPLTDWHEQLYTSECGEWEVSSDDDGLWWGNPNSPNGDNDGEFPVVDPPAHVEIDEDEDMVSVYFIEPVEAGFDIRIEKDILVPYECREYEFAVVEWPTAVPEPSLMLVAAGIMATRLRRRR